MTLTTTQQLIVQYMCVRYWLVFTVREWKECDTYQWDKMEQWWTTIRLRMIANLPFSLSFLMTHKHIHSTASDLNFRVLTSRVASICEIQHCVKLYFVSISTKLDFVIDIQLCTQCVYILYYTRSYFSAYDVQWYINLSVKSGKIW